MYSPERDWKHLRTVSTVALERYCERVLQECAAVVAKPGLTAHERSLELFKLIDERDDQLSGAFDDLDALSLEGSEERRRGQRCSHLRPLRVWGGSRA